MKRILLVILLPVMASCHSTRYIYLVRHAEKQDGTPFSLLSDAVHQRAQVLKDSLIHKKIGAIYATPLERTQQTARPLADAMQKPVSIYRPNAVDSMVSLLKSNGNRNVLVVGHSGPLPAIIEGVTGQKVKPIAEPEYDNFYIIKLKKGKAELVAGKYGSSSTH